MSFVQTSDMSSTTPRSVGKYAEQKKATIQSIYQFMTGDGYPQYPADIFLEVSNLCDLKCAMCGPFSALNPERLSSIKQVLRGFMPMLGSNLDEILAHSLRVQCFGYGEPTLHPDFGGFLDYVGGFETLISFFSNGMHLTPELVKKIVSNRVHSINISFSGSYKEHYEDVYIGGHWETVLSGIQRLAKEKRAQGSYYPIIGVNSLGYEHHVAEFDRFVIIMADMGVNYITLKPIVPVPTTPHIAQHTSTYRPWIEGKILDRAKYLAEKLGVLLDASLYEASGASDENEYAQKRTALARMYGADDMKDLSDIPIGQWRIAAQSVEILKPPSDKSPPTPSAFGMSVEEMHKSLGFLPAEDLGAKDFYCMEPFKTFYVNRNFQVKPCCNSWADPSVFLGEVKKESGEAVWNGAPYKTVRDGILSGQYPNMCHGCLKNGNAYSNNGFGYVLLDYLRWYKAEFGNKLDCRSPELIFGAGSNNDIAVRHQSNSQ